MKILSIDTSFLSDTSIGIYFSDQEQLELHLKAPFSQEEKLMNAIDSGLGILGKTIQEVELIAVGLGPGSFTGIRIGLATAKSLAWSLGIKMAGFSSLEILARSLPGELLSENTLTVPMIDARMNKVFAALFSKQNRITEDMDIPPAMLKEQITARSEKKLLFIGDGFNIHFQALQEIENKEILNIKDFSISGLTLCRLAQEQINLFPHLMKDPKEILPVYLRLSEAGAQLDLKHRSII